MHDTELCALFTLGSGELALAQVLAAVRGTHGLALSLLAARVGAATLRRGIATYHHAYSTEGTRVQRAGVPRDWGEDRVLSPRKLATIYFQS